MSKGGKSQSNELTPSGPAKNVLLIILFFLESQYINLHAFGLSGRKPTPAMIVHWAGGLTVIFSCTYKLFDPVHEIYLIL